MAGARGRAAGAARRQGPLMPVLAEPPRCLATPCMQELQRVPGAEDAGGGRHEQRGALRVLPHRLPHRHQDVPPRPHECHERQTGGRCRKGRWLDAVGPRLSGASEQVEVRPKRSLVQPARLCRLHHQLLNRLLPAPRCRARLRSTPRCCTPTLCACTPRSRTQTASTWCRSMRRGVRRGGGIGVAAVAQGSCGCEAALFAVASTGRVQHASELPPPAHLPVPSPPGLHQATCTWS